MATNEFDRIKFLNEKIFIAPSINITSTSGKGMIIGSYDDTSVTSNVTTGYENDGTVDISGGNASTTALSTSFGTITNNNLIKLDKGVAVYGINGSKLVNNSNATIELSDKGVGMAAFTSGNTLQNYGTDKKIDDGSLGSTEKTLEIENKGLIKSNADGSVGIYGELNNVTNNPFGVEVGAVGTSHGSIRNNGKIILSGDSAVGIVSKVTPPTLGDPLLFRGPEVILNGTGSSDIIVGKKGIGVYAYNTAVNFETNYGVEVKDKGTGIFIEGNNPSLNSNKNFELKYSGLPTEYAVALYMNNKSTSSTASMLNKMNININDTVNTVSNTKGLLGILAKGTAGEINNQGNITADAGYGIISEGVEVRNSGNITLNNPIDDVNKKESVGIYVKNGDKITNSGNITIGKYSVGIYGHEINNSGNINVGNAGTGIFSKAGNVDLTGGTITVGKNQATAVYINGDNQTVTAGSGSNISISDNSFGIISEKGTGSTGNKIISNITNVNNLGNDTVYIYSNDDRNGSQVVNSTNLTSTGSYNYGIYSTGEVTNRGNINFSSGYGNIGIYSTYGGTATNNASITVGESYLDPTDSKNNRYALGMAAGFTPTAADIAAGRTPYTGNIVNNGIINVTGEGSVGMYGTGAGTKVYNGTASNPNAVINLNSSNTTGIYLDNGAYGYNYGTIKSNGAGLSRVVGVVVKNGSTIENHGHIDINALDARGILSKGNLLGTNLGIIKNYGTFNINGVTNVNDSTVTGTDVSDLSKTISGIKIDVPKGSSTGTITVDGNLVIPEIATTSGEEFKPMELSKIGMYIDTSNKVFTNPIIGLNVLKSLKQADLIMGVEATQNTTGKYIQVDSRIIDPYNTTIKDNQQIEKWNIYSGSLTWMSTVAQDQTDGTIKNAYLAKIPYTYWAGNEASPVNSTDSFNFLNGLEQRYGVEALGSRENQLFQKLNGIGNNEEILLYQAADEMMGHQYANIQLRINASGNMLDKEFKYLKHDWRNPSKQNNKIKVFGMKDEYKTDTAGIIDYTSNAYGVAYIHENEKIKMGNSSGWYAGVVNNNFKFKDIGKSRENQTMMKAGVFKTMAPEKDYNGALQWTIGGDIFAGINNMKRKYLVVDNVFQAKSDYYSYGAAFKTDLGYDMRLSKRITFKTLWGLKDGIRKI